MNEKYFEVAQSQRDPGHVRWNLLQGNQLYYILFSENMAHTNVPLSLRQASTLGNKINHWKKNILINQIYIYIKEEEIKYRHIIKGMKS